jgi:predicted O-methyltransferase YrrM
MDMSAGHLRKPSDEYAFTIVKSKPYLDLYAQMAASFQPKSVLELGIFQGGSFVLLDKLFMPERLAAVEISKNPIEPLAAYIDRTANRSAHFGTSQDDAAALSEIIDTELGGRLDMVVDDASHIYELSRRSFEILFPRLSPGGVYIIEDWAWAHDRRYQGEDHPWRKRAALTNLIFEITTLLGSSVLISEIAIHKPLVAITKSAKAPPADDPLWSMLQLRGCKMSHI